MNNRFTSLEVSVEDTLQFLPIDLHIRSSRMSEDESNFAVVVELFLSPDL